MCRHPLDMINLTYDVSLPAAAGQDADPELLQNPFKGKKFIVS